MNNGVTYSIVIFEFTYCQDGFYAWTSTLGILWLTVTVAEKQYTLGQANNLCNLDNLDNLSTLGNLDNLNNLSTLGNLDNLGNLSTLGNVDNLGNRSSGQSGQSEHCHSGQSGSDEERTVFDSYPPQSSESTSAESRRAVPDPVTAVPRPVGLQSPARDLKSGSAEDHRNEPCLFHSYQGCLKGDQCEYSHLTHADQIQIPGPKTRRGHALMRIKRRLAQWLSTADLYLVHHELQEEARKDPYAKDCEKSLEYGIWLG